MNAPGSPRLATRLLAEFLVIVVGVMVALAVDRWLMTLDDRDLERGYVTDLIEDLRSDVEYVSERAASARVRHERVLELLAAAEDPDRMVTDAVSFVVGFETDAWSIVPSFHTTTWTDAQLARFDEVAADVNPPARRLEIVRGFGGEVRPEVTAANLRGLSSAAEETLATFLAYSASTGAP